MGFVRFACFLLVVLPITSLSIMKFHRGLEYKDVVQTRDSFASREKELVSNNIGGRRRLEVKEGMPLESSKSSKMAVSSSFNGENGKKKKKKLGNGSSLVYENADYLTHMHHPPKHN
ncbi:hypothetical protein SDJN02_16868, partial [Cucurbita argyrosperma subsp. argyrosperma]